MKALLKKLCGILLAGVMALSMMPAAAAETEVAINAANFPDANFRSYVAEAFDTDGNGTLSYSEQLAVVIVDCRDRGISDLTGITIFPHVWRLQCSGNNLTKLPDGINSELNLLECDDNQFSSLDISGFPSLKYLFCGDNKLTGLDVSNNTKLIYLSCYRNRLKTLDVSRLAALETLNCWDNQLTTLDLTHNLALVHLECNVNSLAELDLSKNTELEEVNCGYNALGALDVSKNTQLTALLCYKNQLKVLDVSGNTKLNRLHCWGNQLTALDVTGNTKLTKLSCDQNRLTVLDVSKNTELTSLNCAENLLTKLNISSNTGLTKLSCELNQLTTLDISKNKGINAADTDSLRYDTASTILLDSLFNDVQDSGKYYYAPVYWANKHDPQITGGYSDNTFRPNTTCTRAQVVTFLWRAAGKPEPSSTVSKFTDVQNAGSYYYKAVLWAAENEITGGYSDNTFRPNQTVTRGQFVTFLWRYAGKPDPANSVSKFTDVQNAGSYYYNAVLWAAEQGVTSGYNDGTFKPGSTCSRGNVVTFLYRYYN